MTQGRFAGARVLVTGGSRGIGAAVVMAFRDAGAHVAVGGRSPQSFRHFVDRHGGDRVMAATGDVGEPDGCRAVVDTAVAGLGGLDVLVNAAGIYWEAPFEAIDTDHWNATLAVNLGAPFFCSQAALPALRQSHGSIVNIASESGLIGFPGAAAYCAAKGGLVNLTRTLALELAPHVRVNAVCPGNVDTDMMREAGEKTDDPASYRAWAETHAPLGRMADPSEIAGSVLYLASKEAAFITGATLAIDGGQTAGVAKWGHS